MNCLFLILLILIQLPKKEAGAGIAFGGAATDALFGAGSGNALTKITKYAGSVFVGMAVLLSVLHMQAANRGTYRLQQELSRQANTPAPVVPSLPSTNLVTPNVTATPPTQTNTAAPSTSLLTTTPSNTPATAPSVNLETPAPAPAAPATPAPEPAK